MAERRSLKDFEIERVLSEDGRNKFVAVLGRFAGQTGSAVVLLSRRHFMLDGLPSLLSGIEIQDLQFHNDVYAKYTGAVLAEDGAINIDVIHPATDKHISKYSEQHYFLVEETPQQYHKITLPYIRAMPASRLQWVYNILEAKAESERVIFKDASTDTGFLLLPDQKWDQKQLEGLYLQAIVMRRDLSSLRDVTSVHLPLLQNIRQKVRQEVKEKYNVSPEELRMWCHYQPSYYHLHVHCAHMKWDGVGLLCGKAILLDDIIDNVQAIDSAYYAKRTMTFTLGENDPLLAAFRAAPACGAITQ